MARSALRERRTRPGSCSRPHGGTGGTRGTVFVSASACMSSDMTRHDSARVISSARSIVNCTLWFRVESEDATEPVPCFLRDGGPSGEAKGVACMPTEGSDVSQSTASNAVPSAATIPLPQEARDKSGLGGTLIILHGVWNAFSSESTGSRVVQPDKILYHIME